MEFVISQENNPDILEPLKMDFDMDSQGNVDIYFVERLGAVKYFNAEDSSVTKIGELDPATGSEDGLVGIALHPGFATNGWMFLFYSKDADFRISRFTLNTTTKMMDLGSEIIVLAIPSGRGRWHTSGAMNFDVYGDLWINVGDNTLHELGPSSTNDLRGGILRIHPEDDGSYSIPDGNLWEFASDYFKDNGNATASDLYLDESRAKREIYYMGTRNAYTQTLDPVRRWVTYGDCGPDYSSKDPGISEPEMSEEHTVVTEPGFGGWPYFAGTGYRQPDLAGNYVTDGEQFWGDDMSFNSPVNLNTSSGSVPELLPFKEATHVYPHSCAMTGPIYRYDGALNAAGKFPPHYNNVWIVSDINQAWVKAMQVDDEGNRASEPVQVFQDFNMRMALDMQFGPDGALYVLNYSCGAWRQPESCTGIAKITYMGTCSDANLLPARAGCKDQGYAEYDAGAEYDNPEACITGVVHDYRTPIEIGIEFRNNNIHFTRPGAWKLALTNVNGETLQAMTGSGKGIVPLPRHPGVMLVRVETSEGVTVKKISGAGTF